MKNAKLTKRVIDGIKTTDVDCILWDSDLAGFGLRIRFGGSKTFIAQYRVGGGRTGQTRRYTIGRYGVLTVDEARLEARKVLLSAAQGQDPAGRRHARRSEMTIVTLIQAFGRDGANHLKTASRTNTMRRLNNHVVPLLGSKKVSSVRVGDIEQMMRDIKAGRTAKNEKTGHRARVIVKGGEVAATRVVRDLSAVFNFAIRQELVDSNPTSPVKKAQIRSRTRFLNLEEMTRFGAALNELEEKNANAKAIAIMRLWALTGCRRDEIAALKWQEIDFKQACLILEDSKTGRSVRPLAHAALVLLKAQPRVDGCEFVFPSEHLKSFYQGTKRYWVKVLKLANLPGVTPHTLRHTIGSAAVSTGETLAMTGALLGHTNQHSTSIYAHMQQDPARRAAERVVGPIATALGLQEEAEVVDLDERRAAVGS